MSLTEKIKNPNSNIHKWFNENFDFKSLIKNENEKIKGLKTLCPTSDVGYPWSVVGHITEYMLDLSVGCNLLNLYPMRYLKEYHFKEFNKLGFNYYSYQTKRENILNGLTILYKLALYEAEMRRGNDVTLMDDGMVLNSVIVNDLKNLLSVVEKKLNKSDKFIFSPNLDQSLTRMLGGADADLIQVKEDGSGLLLDLKTTKNSKIDKYMLFQILGYTLLDSNNDFNITEVGLFLTRQDVILKFDIDKLLSCSSFSDLEDCRNSFCYQIIKDNYKEFFLPEN